MRCPRCGDITDDSDRFCSSCGQDLVTYRNLWPQTPARTSGPLTPPPAGTPHPQQAEPERAEPLQTEALQAEPPQTEAATEAPNVPTYLGWAAALTTLCWPALWAGIPALVHASRVESRLAAGDLEGARESSQRARTWCWVTFWAGLVLWAVILTLVVTL